MMILFREEDLKLIKTQAVLQNFENHDGFLLKAYVIGDYFHLVLRPSIKNLSKDHDPIIFNSHHVSKESSHSELNNDGGIPQIEDICVEEDLIKRTIDALRTHLDLELFGVDFLILPPSGHEHRLAVIDVNIFPDYNCVPGFFFHLENLVRTKLDLPKLTSSSIFTCRQE
ncbi:unnamed protein product [Mesocestoides corti]|nr:unnamed protein product [Mesocestoides corti]